MRSSDNIWLHRFAVLTAAATLVLICVGGLVTSHGVGLSVPDWPTTYGHNMFFFPISKWVGGIFYEHSHRLVASTVGLLTIILAAWLALKEERRWLRALGWWALIAVIVQGVLGGLRVTALKDELGIFHASLAQLFLVLVSAIALFTSSWWVQPANVSGERGRDTRFQSGISHDGVPQSRNVDRGLRTIYWSISTVILFQLILGATMRHQHAGLAIPDFPTAYGELWPKMDAASVERYNQRRGEMTALNPITGFQIGLQMAHRIVAALIVIAVAWAAVFTARRQGRSCVLSKLSMFWLALISTQVLLGMITIWTNKSADVATAHVAVGALSLVTGVLLSLMAGRKAMSLRPAPVSDAHIQAEIRSPSAHLRA